MTGYAGQPHVAAADQGSLFEALIRGGQFVMEAGSNFAASVVSNNQIRVSDGELMMQGRHVKLAPGSYVDLTIENGAQGYLRNDLIVARYTQTAETGVEECSLVVLKGTPATGNPSTPKYTTGSINANGALQHDFPLYRVPLSGLTVGELEPLFEPQKALYDSLLSRKGGTMTGNITMSGYTVTGLGTPKATGDAVPFGYAKDHFAPAGYVQYDVGVGSEEELNAAVANAYAAVADGKIGFAKISLRVALSIPGGVWFVTIYRASDVNGYISAVRYGTGEYIRYLNNGTWGEWIDNRPSAFASSGYGYGELPAAYTFSNDNDGSAFETAMTALLDQMERGEARQIRIYDYPAFSAQAWLATIWKHDDYAVISAATYSGYRATKIRVAGVWKPWEWENPPMYVGTEYRTTERYDGAVVYKKVDTNGDVLWRTEGDNRWRLLAAASYVATATVE